MKISVDSILSSERLASIKKRMSAIITNKHINTILPMYLTQSLVPQYIRERIDTPDGDFIDLDWINKEVCDKPTVILFHGFEGNSRSHYAKRIMYYLEQIGWRGVVPHYRGCSEEINRQPTFYHAGQTEDMTFVINEVKSRTNREIFAIGVSLGGNALLKYLGEHPDNELSAALALSVPFNLDICINDMDKGFNKYIYVKHFLSSLLPKMKEYASMFDNFNYANHKVDTLDEFNNTYMCQFFDFKNSADYYQQANCVPFLKHIKTPTVILQAENDPMVPIAAWPNKENLSSNVSFIATKTGGHAGYIGLTTNLKDALLKLPKFVVTYFKQFENGEKTGQENPLDIIEEFMIFDNDDQKEKTA
ncbi:MAG: alpha/beta hydrolase [Burkholderiales bacterium]|jgi:predicted alpha/beta-fold hydrolase|nr:alpha/beta hydrolase [Burkholderiales bacterium]